MFFKISPETLQHFKKCLQSHENTQNEWKLCSNFARPVEGAVHCYRNISKTGNKARWSNSGPFLVWRVGANYWAVVPPDGYDINIFKSEQWKAVK